MAAPFDDLDTPLDELVGVITSPKPTLKIVVRHRGKILSKEVVYSPLPTIPLLTAEGQATLMLQYALLQQGVPLKRVRLAPDRMAS